MSLGNALSYLTVLPLPSKKSIPLLRSVHYFPLVGAAMGTLAVLFFLAAQYLLSSGVACFLTVAALEFLGRGTPLRGVAEMAQGRRTYPGHGFEPYFKVEFRGFAAVLALLAVKTVSLLSLPPEWQPHAVFVLPILGHCAQTLAFVLSFRHLPPEYSTDSLIVRRRVRAACMSATLLLLLFLFPIRVAVPALALFAVIVLWGIKRCNALFGGLTLQTLSLLSELSEAAVLLLLAVVVKMWV